jgi:hypothetical protein
MGGPATPAPAVQAPAKSDEEKAPPPPATEKTRTEPEAPEARKSAPSERPKTASAPATPIEAKRSDPKEIEFRSKIEGLGLTLEQRQAIGKEALAAEDRAMWEASRFYPTGTKPNEHLQYYEKAFDKYRSEVMTKHKLTKDQLSLIDMESLLDKWPKPEYPTFDIEDAASHLRINVYTNQGSLTYHRINCTLLDRNRPHVKLTLHQAITTPGSRPCGACAP